MDNMTFPHAVHHLESQLRITCISIIVDLFAERSDVGIYKCSFKDVVTNNVAGVVIFNISSEYRLKKLMMCQCIHSDTVRDVNRKLDCLDN